MSDASPPPAPPASRLAALGLIALMVIGSLMLWIGAPLFWVWLGSQLQASSQPTLGPYVVVLGGVVASMIVISKLLSRLNRLYGRVTGTGATVRVRAPWHRSLRGERTSGRPTSVLDVVMVASVSAALLTFALWFLLLAGSSLPGA